MHIQLQRQQSNTEYEYDAATSTTVHCEIRLYDQNDDVTHARKMPDDGSIVHAHKPK